MGVPRNHCEKILENVNKLRQTMFGHTHSSSLESDQYSLAKQFPALTQASWALKSVAMNANYRGMNQYPEEYAGYGQGNSSMQSMAYHQANFDASNNTAMMNPMSGGGAGAYGGQGYDASAVMMAGQGAMSAHAAAMYQQQQQQQRQQQQQQQAFLAQQQQQAQQQYYASQPAGNTGASSAGGQYAGQSSFPMQGGSGQYYPPSSSQGQGQTTPGVSKMAPPPHHHLRNTSGQQNPQQVADSILQMASAFPSHHTVQVPLKNRHAPYQIPRSPQSYSGQQQPSMGGQQQQMSGMGGQQQMSGQQQHQVMTSTQCMAGQQTINAGQMQPLTTQAAMARAVAAMGQQQSMMYSGASPHHQMSSPMSPLVQQQGQGLPSPAGAMSSPGPCSNPAVCSPVPTSPGLVNNMRSPPSVPLRSPAHMASGYAGQSINSPTQRQFESSSQHCQSISSPSQRQFESSSHCQSISSPTQRQFESSQHCQSISSPSQRQFESSSHYQSINSPSQRQYDSSSQHCSPPSLHSPASHASSPYAGMVPHHINSPPQQSFPGPPTHSPYNNMDLMDSGQGPGGSAGSAQRSLSGQGSSFDPIQSLQKLVMLPETQVVDPKSVVSEACLQNDDDNSKNCEDPAERSREAVDCSAGVPVSCSPPDFSAGDSSAAPAQSGLPGSEKSVHQTCAVDTSDQASSRTEQTTSAQDAAGTHSVPRTPIQKECSPSDPQPVGVVKTPVASPSGTKSPSKTKKKSDSTSTADVGKLVSTGSEMAVASAVKDDGHKNNEESKTRTSHENELKEEEPGTDGCNGLDASPTAAASKSDSVVHTDVSSDVKPANCEQKLSVCVDEKVCATKNKLKPSPPAPSRQSRRLAEKTPGQGSKYQTSTAKSETESATGLVEDSTNPVQQAAPSCKPTTKTESGTNTTESMSDIAGASTIIMPSEATLKLVNGFRDNHTSESIFRKDQRKRNLVQRRSKSKKTCVLTNASESKTKAAGKQKSPDSTPVGINLQRDGGIATQRAGDKTHPTERKTSKMNPADKASETQNKEQVDSKASKNKVSPTASKPTDSKLHQSEKRNKGSGVGAAENKASKEKANPTEKNTNKDKVNAAENKSEDSKLSSDLSAGVSSVSAAQPAPESDDEDSSSSNMDFGYDSPPCDLMEDHTGEQANVKKQRPSTSGGADEADGNGERSERGNKSVQSKGKVSPGSTGKPATSDGLLDAAKPESSSSTSPNTSVSAKVIPPPHRVVTRSSTGKVFKRRFSSDDESPAPKRARRSSGTSDNQSSDVSLSMECEEIDTKADSDVEVISSSDEAAPTVKVSRQKVKPVVSGKKSPVVVLSKAAPINSKLPQQKSPGINAMVTGSRRKQSFQCIRNEDGKFVPNPRQSVGTSTCPVTASLSPVNGVKKVDKGQVTGPQDKNTAASILTISVDSGSEDEPLIVVQRRASRDSEGTSTDAKDSNLGGSLLLTKLASPNRARQSATVAHLSSPVRTVAATLPVHKPASFTVSSQPARPATSHARTDSSTLTNLGMSKKEQSDTSALKKKSKKSVKSKKNTKQVFEQDTADASFKSMKFSMTLNHLQQNKKKGDGSQQAGAFSPFVRVQGSGDIPLSVSVFNNPPTSTKDSKSAGKTKNVASSGGPVGTIPITNLTSDKTVLVPYSKTTETNWACGLCGKRSSYRFLGDLFGPYFLESHLPALAKAEGSKKEGGASKDSAVAGSDSQNTHNTRRKSVQHQRSSSGGEEVSTPQEVWVHEDCVLWSSGVYVVGTRIYGMEESLKAACTAVCTCCREKGAFIGCLHKGCNQNFHYVCAVDKMCFLDVENFSMLCPKHKERRQKSAAVAGTSEKS